MAAIVFKKPRVCDPLPEIILPMIGRPWFDIKRRGFSVDITESKDEIDSIYANMCQKDSEAGFVNVKNILKNIEKLKEKIKNLDEDYRPRFG